MIEILAQAKPAFIIGFQTIPLNTNQGTIRMADFLYYPKTTQSLDEIGNRFGFGETDDSKQSLYAANSRLKRPTTKNFNKSPIVLPGSHCKGNKVPYCSTQEHKRLGTLSHQVGGAATLALAELVDEVKVPSFAGDLNTFGGNGIGAAAQASGFMVKDIANYDKLLKEYYDLKNHRAVPPTLMRKEAELKKAFKKMNHSLNQRGQQILQKYVSKTKQVLTSRGKVGFESIPISNQLDVQRLIQLARFGKVAGPGFILLDGYFRYDKVAAMYKQNHANWKREAVVQSAGFVAGIAAGAGIIFVIGAAPLGLVVGIIAAGAMAIIADKAATGLINKGYELLVY